MAHDVIDSPGVPPLPQTARKAASTAGAPRTLGVAPGAGRGNSSLGFNLVGPGISHYAAGRGTLAGFHHGVLLCLEKSLVPQASSWRSTRWMNF